ncbi:polycystin-2-like [Corticium candelabrum]|uniref:polycystin-2-like n=1 Tax=Corticium candelabrum TaxID=121492 RepID=UPI002E304350|nr:polycystin-2-like [Corticium candelabrum]
MRTTISTILGQFHFYGWVEEHRILAPIMFFFFNLIVLLILLSVFVALLNLSVSVVKQSLLQQSNDFEVIEYMTKRMRLWLGCKPKDTNNPDEGIDSPAVSAITARDIEVTDTGQEESLADNHFDDKMWTNIVPWPRKLQQKMDKILSLLDKISDTDKKN